MITRDAAAFLEFARSLAPDFGPATARGAFLVAPDGFRRATESAADNHYMADAAAFDTALASTQHRALQQALSRSVPTVCFAGDPEMPDALFPNNVFATARPDARVDPTANGSAIIGRMRHAVRQREASRSDIRGFFRDVMGYREIDLSSQPHACELTGALVVDRLRGIGLCGLSERCDEDGARLMHDAFGLRATFLFDLAPGEYHANVVLAVLAGRAALICPRGFADPSAVDAIATLYAPHAIVLSPDEHAAFVGNSIALSPDCAWMSATAERALEAASRAALERAGFAVRGVELSAIEAGGGSLRCCIGEIF